MCEQTQVLTTRPSHSLSPTSHSQRQLWRVSPTASPICQQTERDLLLRCRLAQPSMPGGRAGVGSAGPEGRLSATSPGRGGQEHTYVLPGKSAPQTLAGDPPLDQKCRQSNRKTWASRGHSFINGSSGILTPRSPRVVGRGLWSRNCAYFDKRFIHIEHSEMVALLHSKFPVHSNLERINLTPVSSCAGSQRHTASSSWPGLHQHQLRLP